MQGTINSNNRIENEGLVPCQVSVFGPYVDDVGHCGPWGRAEIHPVTGMLLDAGQSNGQQRYLLMAFSDNSTVSPLLVAGKRAPVYLAHTDRHLTVTFDWPPEPRGMTGAQPTHNYRDLLPGKHGSSSIRQVGTAGAPRLAVTIATGTPDEGKGMYAALFWLGWSKGIVVVPPPSPGPHKPIGT
jgi:hypothetical protein